MFLPTLPLSLAFLPAPPKDCAWETPSHSEGVVILPEGSTARSCRPGPPAGPTWAQVPLQTTAFHLVTLTQFGWRIRQLSILPTQASLYPVTEPSMSWKMEFLSPSSSQSSNHGPGFPKKTFRETWQQTKLKASQKEVPATEQQESQRSLASSTTVTS